MGNITKEEFIDSLQGFPVSRETIEKLMVYEQLLKKWQKSINLISDSTIDDIWGRHFLDSAQLVKYIPQSNCRIVDFGSGAGFPILVYATLLQNAKKPPSDKAALFQQCRFAKKALYKSGEKAVY